MKKILISTGGSGGHVIPALTLYDHFNEKFEAFLVTDQRGAKYIDKDKYSFEIIDTPKISKNIFKIPFILIFFSISILNSFLYLKKNKIKYLISTGGYMSSPFCIVAKILRINILLFEPNMVLGRSNKMFLNSCNKIICYSDNIQYFPNKYNNKIFLTEPLLRKEMYDLEKNTKTEINEPFRILVTGGSQGAKFFDEKIKELIVNLSKENKIYLIQQVFDEKKKKDLEKEYNDNNIDHELYSFDNKLYKKISKIDFAITRAGASTISELIFYNIPFLAIPYPYAKDNHQFYNAKNYLDKDLCWMIRQEDFEVKKVSFLLKNLLNNKEEYFSKKNNIEKFSYQNTWNNINQKLISIINEN